VKEAPPDVKVRGHPTEGAAIVVVVDVWAESCAPTAKRRNRRAEQEREKRNLMVLTA